MSITTAQIRGARGILNWSQSDLAAQTGISTTSIGAIENAHTKPRENTLRKIQNIFETAGIEFMDTEGVRMKSSKMKVFQGRKGYLEFFEEVYKEIELHNIKEIYVSNVDERDFSKWHGTLGETHINRMTQEKDVKYKILVREGDEYLPAGDYAEYRWMEKGFFYPVPFYLFGDKLAIILFDNEPTILMIDYPAVAKAYQVQFDALWKKARQPETA